MKAKKQKKRIKRINARPYVIFTGPGHVEKGEAFLKAMKGGNSK